MDIITFVVKLYFHLLLCIILYLCISNNQTNFERQSQSSKQVPTSLCNVNKTRDIFMFSQVQNCSKLSLLNYLLIRFKHTLIVFTFILGLNLKYFLVYFQNVKRKHDLIYVYITKNCKLFFYFITQRLTIKFSLTVRYVLPL